MRSLFDGGVYLKVGRHKELFQLQYNHFSPFDFDCIGAAALIFVPKAALNTGGAYSSKYGILYHICISVLAHRATRNSMNMTKNTFLPCLRWNKVKLT